MCCIEYLRDKEMSMSKTTAQLSITVLFLMFLAACGKKETTGVAECDQMLENVRTCLDSHAPREMLDAFDNEMKSVRTNLKALSESNGGHNYLEHVCKQSADNYRMMYAEFKCKI